MYKLYEGSHETMRVNTIAYHKEGDEYIMVAVVDYNEETGEYVLAHLMDKIGVGGQRRVYYSPDVYFKR